LLPLSGEEEGFWCFWRTRRRKRPRTVRRNIRYSVMPIGVRGRAGEFLVWGEDFSFEKGKTPTDESNKGPEGSGNDVRGGDESVE
jgi:hypothetical protein